MTLVIGLHADALARRIASAPQLRAPDAAHARVADWLAEIAETSAGEVLARLLAEHRPADSVLSGQPHRRAVR